MRFFNPQAPPMQVYERLTACVCISVSSGGRRSQCNVKLLRGGADMTTAQKLHDDCKECDDEWHIWGHLSAAADVSRRNRFGSEPPSSFAGEMDGSGGSKININVSPSAAAQTFALAALVCLAARRAKRPA